MKISNLVIWLSSLIVLLALIAASLGLFWQDGGNSFSFTTLRGDTVSIAGRGLYRYDPTLMAMGFKAGDAVTLILGIPALIFSLALSARLCKGWNLIGGDVSLLSIQLWFNSIWSSLQPDIPRLCRADVC
jgi:hypothetical protein